MSAHTALRLAVRPRRGAAFLDWTTTSTRVAAPRPVSHRPPICLRCSIAVDFRTGPARARLFSTAPPPRRQPPPPSPDDNIGKPEPEPPTPKDAPSTTSSPLPEHSEQPKQSARETESAPTSSSDPSPDTPKEESSPPPPENETNEANNNPPDPSLPSFTEGHRHSITARFSTFMDNLQSRAVTATQTLNDLTGYSAIEAIKARNNDLETEHITAQHRLRAARHAYKSLTAHRAATQREVTTLLARKDTWNPSDLERFTTLYRLDHELETQVTAAAAELTEAETDEGKLSGALTAGILKRYHEEQIWSDRIRRQSTWGTWGLMGVNVVMFLVLQFVAEPWRRKRLMRGIAESEKGVMEEVRRELGEVKAALEASGLRERADAAAVAARAEEEEDAAAAVAETLQAVDDAEQRPVIPPMVLPVEAKVPRKPWKEALMDYWEDPELLRDAVLDLNSDRRIDLRMRDASLIALQGAAAGAAVAVVLAVSLLRNSSI
ncbi:sensitive to high expression protein 9, mitochondrial [Chaetomidium leptoderma]|uniref:Sensitive to high expression protein 9, mitochondrial n=1 Tax=Chaetomidium leptoderma TaxID=669021 RepID=A0AAN6VPL3_9PEZI|nr:sensitive to high expression protein 9, mitochondrial [Chaetomidium leptoderma]